MTDNQTNQIVSMLRRSEVRESIAFGVVIVMGGLNILALQLNLYTAVWAAIILGIVGVLIMTHPWWRTVKFKSKS